MEVIATKPVLKGTVLEVMVPEYGLVRNDFPPRVEESFAGKNPPNPPFRIPAADKKGDLFFDNREVMCRFASMPTPIQEEFLRCVRWALKKNQVETLHLTVAWGAKDRVLKIHAGGVDCSIDIFVN